LGQLISSSIIPQNRLYFLRMKNDSQNVWKFSEFENSDHYPIDAAVIRI
jgi:hypothetical protein